MDTFKIFHVRKPSLTNHLVAYLDQKVYQTSSEYKLNSVLFDIQTPFVMDSERFWEPIEKRRNKSAVNLYLNSLTEVERVSIDAVLELIFKERRHIKLTSSDSNHEAKQLASLIRLVKGNEYESYFNQSNNVVKLGSYIIPARSSFYAGDASQGLLNMVQSLQHNRFLPSRRFLIILDPPWNGNKSVKRKKCYQTNRNEDILGVCKNLKSLLIALQVSRISNCESNHESDTEMDIAFALWTTEKYKNFVWDQILKECFEIQQWRTFLWHKVTKNGLSAKIRGSKEYLIVASTKSASKSPPSPLTTTNVNKESGIIISIPSSIHSHKPPLSAELVWSLLGWPQTESGSFKTDSNTNLKLDGLEIYARYLRPGFHSIGNECLKLQFDQLYVTEEA